jgi:hypothetical protein
VRTMLSETAKALFSGERDQRLYRVIDLTYLNPAPKQEAAADRVGISFSTYRRYLAAGVERLTEWLWRQGGMRCRWKRPRNRRPDPPPSTRKLRHCRSAGAYLFLNLSQDPKCRLFRGRDLRQPDHGSVAGAAGQLCDLLLLTWYDSRRSLLSRVRSLMLKSHLTWTQSC